MDPRPPAVDWGSGVAESCGVGHRHGSEPALLGLWCVAGSCNSHSTPSLGMSICYMCGPKKQNGTKQNKTKQKRVPSESVISPGSFSNGNIMARGYQCPAGLRKRKD